MKNRKQYFLAEKEVKNFNCKVVKQYAITYAGDTHPWFRDDLTYEQAKEALEKQLNTYYLSDFSEDEIKEFFHSINFIELFDFTNNLLGLNLTYKVELDEKKYTHFSIESKEDLTSMFNILLVAWKEFKVATFNSEIAVDKSTGELFIWGNLQYAYTHQNGGWNGAEIVSFTYNKSTGWNIRAEMQRGENNE